MHRPSTLGELRAAGHQHKPVKAEIRDNLVALMRSGERRFEGILGFEETVLPALERALLAGHDVVILGERGQGKTRLIRTLVALLDEWSPVVDGCEINDHPEAPVCARCQRLHAELGDELPVGWRHRSERYGEKLATPDTSVGDLIGDIDPVKVAEGRTLGDPETVHFGLVPRTNRGIFAINELPDLAERIQVSLLNVLEERDIQVRGYQLRLPLDVLLVASANPEDYTNRGRIISPLKDRFGAEIRTHYPDQLQDEVDVVRQEAHLAAVVPDFLVEVVARFARNVRESSSVDQRSGVSARFGIAAAETAAASALRRAALTGEDPAVARVCDLPATVATLRGKVEFEVDEEGRELEVLAHLLRKATVETFRHHLGASDLRPLIERFDEGLLVESGDLVPGRRLLEQVGPLPGLAHVMDLLGVDEGAETPELAASALEFALEGLFLNRRISKDDGIDGGVRYGVELTVVPRGYRYGSWHDGPDPLAPPYDVRRALDRLGDDVLSGSTPRDALRRLLRRGLRGDDDRRRGLDDMMRRLREQRRQMRERGRLDGTLEEVRRLVDTAVGQERSALFPDPSDDARFREASLDALPSDPARAVRQLDGYDWRSPEAAQTFEQVKDLLRREVLDTQFRGMKQALENPDPAAMQRVKDMMAALNAMLAADARGEHTQEAFAEFMATYGDMFPDDPKDLEELVDSLARRAAAAERMMRSLSAEQRDELAALMAGALEDMDLAREMNQLSESLRARRPDLDWHGRERMEGDQPLGAGEATSALQDLADIDELESAMAQDYPGASLEDIDEEAVRRALGRRTADDLQELRRIERELEGQGYLNRSGGRLDLTPKAIRRLGQTALRRVFADLTAAGRGGHDVHDAGQAGELTGSSRAWHFGDEQPLDVVRTLTNAVRSGRADLSGADRSIRLSTEDFEVAETDRRTSAAVCLLVDLSYSMVLRDTWGVAKSTALALHALVSGQFPQDALTIIGFSSYARTLAPTELAGLDADYVQGTNLQHALILAGRFLDEHPQSEPVVLVVTDGEPTAHLLPGGRPWFAWPPEPETIALTVAEVDRMTRRGAALNVFALDDDPRLVGFMQELARRNGGRVLQPDPRRLGQYVVSDYLARRTGRNRRTARRAG